MNKKEQTKKNPTLAVMTRHVGSPDEWAILFGLLFASHDYEKETGNEWPLDTLLIAERLDELKNQMLKS